MPIKLKSTGGGSVTLDVPSTGSDFTIIVPANNATLVSANGSVLANVTFSNTLTFDGSSISMGNANITSDITLSVVPVFRNTPNINFDYTFSNAYNELSIGPITVANGVNVSVANGATWTVV